MDSGFQVETVPEELPESGGCMTELGWLGAGFILPCASLAFYRLAAGRRARLAVLFYALFALALAAVSALTLGRGMLATGREIRTVFERGALPEITIENGIARAEGPQPFIMEESGTTFIVDTTGRIDRLDPERFRQGILLTRDSLQILDEGRGLREIPLSELQEMFGGGPIQVNPDTLAQFWQWLSVLIVLGAFLVVGFWHLVLRLLFLAVLALIFWVIVRLSQPKIAFESVLVTGIYASVPAIYASYLLERIGAAFTGLQSLLLLVIWGGALMAILRSPAEPGESIQLHAWHALFGVPLLLILAADKILAPARGAWLVWPAALLTMLVLLGARLAQANGRDEHVPG